MADVEPAAAERGSADVDRTKSDVELPGEVSISLQPDQLPVRSTKIFHATWRNDSTRDASCTTGFFVPLRADHQPLKII